ncbi:MAG: DUF423 domain-containing protein [Candidatus Omnitrophica bacterium]|nr:DUF423 domain-containing protein [Candidatus Omnitrophota bacterium]
MNWIRIASFFMFLAVALGAFGAHAIRSKISEHYFDIYRTAVLYQFVHALGLFVVAWLSTISHSPRVGWAGYLMIAGIILFCGSLYALSLTGIKWLGALTPIGGLCFLAAWACLMLV